MGLLDVKKTPEMNATSEVAECDRQIAVKEQRKQEVTAHIGQLYVEANDVKSAEGTVYEESIREIERIKGEIINLEIRKLAVQGLRKCEKCGNILVLDSAFCNKCGEKLETLFIPTEQNPYICAKCGTPYKEGTAFCTGCGNKLN